MMLRPGVRVGPYEIVASIGAGGMGEVYRARDPRLHREVAIKILRLEAPDDELRFRIEREARLIAGIQHPNICAVYDIGDATGVPYLVMELLEGQTLAERLARGSIPLEQALRMAVQVAAAMDAAHRRGLVHRDLKPGNIMLTRAGVKLLDFGLARPALPHLHLQFTAGSAGVTTPMGSPLHTTVAGTLPYMAPEQIEGKPVDARADIFSFGAVLYEMVTGRRAFAGDSAGRIVASIMTEEPTRMSRFQPDTPPALEELVRTCLAKDKDERWQSAHDLSRTLTWLADGSGAVSHEEATTLLRKAMRARKRARWLTAAAATIVLTVAGVASWRARPATTHAPIVVVLPCRAVDGGTDKPFCDGIAETLAARLSSLSGGYDLQVVPSSMVRAQGVATAQQARSVFGATFALEGSVLRAGDTLRLNYFLVNPETNQQVDAVSLTAPAGNPFAMQDQVVEWATQVLELGIGDRERAALRARDTQVADAFRSYQEGRGRLAAHQTADDVDAAIALLTTAVERDPRYVQAHATLGQAYWQRYLLSRDPAWVDRARAACDRAAALDAAGADAQYCLGEIALGTGRHDQAIKAFRTAADREPTSDDAYLGLARAYEAAGDTASAERVYRQAIERRPRYWSGHWWLGNLLRQQARYPEALAAFERAVALNPGNANLHARLGGVYMYLGRYEEAQNAFRTANAIATTPAVLGNWGVTLYRQRDFDAAAAMLVRACALRESYQCTSNLARAYYFDGKRAEATRLLGRAIELAQRELEINPNNVDARLSLAEVYARMGRRAEALEHVARVDPGRDPHLMFFVALVHAQIGDRAAAFDWLRRAVAGNLPRAELRAWPELDPLRQDPQFRALVGTQRSGA
jgi:serine/threonine-protein kinase